LDQALHGIWNSIATDPLCRVPNQLLEKKRIAPGALHAASRKGGIPVAEQGVDDRSCLLLP